MADAEYTPVEGARCDRSMTRRAILEQERVRLLAAPKELETEPALGAGGDFDPCWRRLFRRSRRQRHRGVLRKGEGYPREPIPAPVKNAGPRRTREYGG
jgi:hypothetical protein